MPPSRLSNLPEGDQSDRRLKATTTGATKLDFSHVTATQESTAAADDGSEPTTSLLRTYIHKTDCHML